MRLHSDEPNGINSFSSPTSFIFVTSLENERNVVGELETNQFVMSVSVVFVGECEYTTHQPTVNSFSKEVQSKRKSPIVTH